MIFLQNLTEVGSGNTITDRLDLGGLQVERYISKSYSSQENQALSRCFFSVFRGLNYFSTFHHACIYQQLSGFYEFHFKFKE